MALLAVWVRERGVGQAGYGVLEVVGPGVVIKKKTKVRAFYRSRLIKLIFLFIFSGMFCYPCLAASCFSASRDAPSPAYALFQPLLCLRIISIPKETGTSA